MMIAWRLRRPTSCAWSTLMPSMCDRLDQSIWGLVDGRSWLWCVIDNVVWTNSWPSIAGASCGLICVGAGEERAQKVYAFEDQSIRGPVDGHSWLWWVFDNIMWTDSWASIAGAGCVLICVGGSDEWAWKVYALRGLRGVERQVGWTRGTRWPMGSSVDRMVARKARRSRRSEPV
jgi:hypothetical protein